MARDNSMYQDVYRQPAGSSFHQNSGEEHERQAVISSGAYGPQTDWSKYASAYTGNNNSGKTTNSGTGTAAGQTTEGAGYDMAAYLAELNAQRQAAAEAAYSQARGLLSDAYDKAAGNYANIYNSGVGTLDKSYDNSRGKIDNQAKDSLRQAYLNYMLSKKNLPQQLAAQGISGGESETSAVRLYNNYGNSRNNINKTWNENLSDLELGYNQNLANLYAAYQERMAALDNSRAAQEAQLLSNLNNQIASVQGDYYSSLASNPDLLRNAISNAVGNLNNIEPVQTVATNEYKPVSTQQVNDQGSNLTNYWRLLQELDSQGMGKEGITNRLHGQGASLDDIGQLLAAYYSPAY